MGGPTRRGFGLMAQEARPRRRRRHLMQVKIFFWFGIVMFVATGTAFGTYKLLADPTTSWHRQERGALHFMSTLFARKWDDPVARDDLAKDVARDLDVGLQLRAEDGTVLSTQGPFEGCAGHGIFAIDVNDGARGRVGTIDVCSPWARSSGNGWRFGTALFAAFFVVWAFAGMVARFLARPLVELTRVTQAIGRGDLASRNQLCRRHHGEIGELTESVYDMAERIERQMRDQRELLAAVSHEVRTPLARIRVLSEMAREGTTGRDPLTDIEDEVDEIDGLVGNLLAGSRLDFGDLAPRTLDVRQVVEKAVERAGVPVDGVELESGAGTIEADPTLLGRALVCLLDNARKHGGPHVTVRVRDQGPRVLFEVEDDGLGFAEGEEEKLFEAFARGRGSAERGGVGLGLSLVRRIAEAHGGAAYAGRRPGGGARVTIELPRRAAA